MKWKSPERNQTVRFALTTVKQIYAWGPGQTEKAMEICISGGLDQDRENSTYLPISCGIFQWVVGCVSWFFRCFPSPLTIITR